MLSYLTRQLWTSVDCILLVKNICRKIAEKSDNAKTKTKNVHTVTGIQVFTRISTGSEQRYSMPYLSLVITACRKASVLRRLPLFSAAVKKDTPYTGVYMILWYNCCNERNYSHDSTLVSKAQWIPVNSTKTFVPIKVLMWKIKLFGGISKFK